MKGAARGGRQTRSPELARSRADILRGTGGLRTRLVMLGIAFLFGSIALQLARLATTGGLDMVATLTEPVARSYVRPDILDRGGRLLATDIEMPSLYADPFLVQSIDEVTERLGGVLPDLNEGELRRTLSDRNRRFIWLKRGMPPKVAQRVHDLGLPGLDFRTELRRAYPLERLAGHVLGSVNVDNRGISGIERAIDDTIGVEPSHGAASNAGTPVRLTLDLGVQHAVEDELLGAMTRFEAKGAAGLVMDIRTGEMLAASSLPGLDPSQPGEALAPERLDKIQGGTYELGSIFKILTVAMALEGGNTKLDTVLDVTKPLTAGRFTIKDLHSSGRPLTVSEVFIHSSNVGSGLLALAEGPDKQKAFLEKLGLMTPMRTDAGPVAPPQLPPRFGRVEQITVAYGHGMAVAPIQFAAATAAVLNGGTAVTPTYFRGRNDAATPGARLVSAETSNSLRVLLRRNVSEREGTGRRADVPGYRVGGKTGTAEMPGRGGYQEKSVVASFLAAFPMDAPQYLVLVLLFEPKGTAEADGEVLAGRNAAPTAGRVIARIAPLLGVKPDGDVAQLPAGTP
ncbi:penicillin-binding protein 2 [Hyphomicrobium sp. LHD-15]|uniref:peptidoglycan D,D-transpeptidase FtsI family protein n=1 Tax=Hyphomicrobium sp. LHD-15 TaxID=3072142 RepID=UPI00280F3678|nr:penicillin-binding protein 2 [Hyphomicrobium sp. LHD-15]MDQ8698192.1 penicillin-binding protein 2 [Hyphomicrobium sp. LHD-15]